MNNKAYVFTPFILVLFVLIALTVIFFNNKVNIVANQASSTQSIIDSVNYDYEKRVIGLIDDFKIIVYGNLSDSYLVDSFIQGSLIDNPSLPLIISSFDYFKSNVNVSFPEKTIDVPFDYPIASLRNAENNFSAQSVQNCLDINHCSDNRGSFDSLLINCFPLQINGFQLRNSSVPQLIGSNISVNLVLFNDSMTLLYPYSLKKYVFTCGI